MRLLKKWERINFDANRERIAPYREFYLTSEELSLVRSLPVDLEGNIISSQDSEELLSDILKVRGMESLLYPALEREDWSGYVKVFDSGLFWML